MDAEKLMKFADTRMLLEETKQILDEVGAHKFLHGANEKVHKAKEAFFAFFFVLSLNKFTGVDWRLRQITEEFPDFDLMAFQEEDPYIQLQSFELVTIPDRCSGFKEMFEIVKNKIEKKRYSPPKSGCSLLVFINHSNAPQWAFNLKMLLNNFHPFKEVWVTFLRFENPNTVKLIETARIRPQPILEGVVSLDDPDLHTTQPLPAFIEPYEEDGNKYIRPTAEFVTMIKRKIGEDRAKPRV